MLLEIWLALIPVYASGNISWVAWLRDEPGTISFSSLTLSQVNTDPLAPFHYCAAIYQAKRPRKPQQQCTVIVYIRYFLQNRLLILTWINSLGPSEAIWRWRSWSKLVQVMACSLMAPSHYLNQCWLIVSKVLWHSSEDIVIRRFEDTNQ